MTERFDVLALGETMLSLIAADGSLATARTFHATHGGAESNACVALARAGFRVAWISRLGADDAGARIRDALEREGVDLRWVATDPLRSTGLMFRDRAGGLAYLRADSRRAGSTRPTCVMRRSKTRARSSSPGSRRCSDRARSAQRSRCSTAHAGSGWSTRTCARVCGDPTARRS